MLPEGFIYFPNFISLEEEKKIINNLSHLSWQEVKMYGVIAKRKVIHYGLDYTYNSRTVNPTDPPPSYIVSLIEKSANILKIHSDEIVETLITFYPVGAGIGWHKDASVFGNKIFGISLQSPCIIKFRKKHNDKYIIVNYDIEPRSAYILSSEARWDWQHSISPVKSPRYSITFRMLNKNNV
jgi:alkylated DNA repair protein (DNA oxidative demethylase)